MKSDVLIIYGSLNSVPSPEGAAPAKVIYETVESLHDNQFKTLSNYNPKLKSVSYDKDVFLHVKPNAFDAIILLVLKLFYPYKKRKHKFVTTSNEQLLYFVSVCRFLFFNRYKKVVVHVSVGLVNMIKLLLPNRDVVFFHHGTSLHTKYDEKQWQELIVNCKAIFGVNDIAFHKANSTLKTQLESSKYFAIPNAIIPIMTLDEVSDNYKNRTDNPNVFVFAFSGRICIQKGVLNLIIAFHDVYKKNKNVKLIVFGGAGAIGKYDKTTSYIQECFNYSAEHKLPVEFTGFLKNSDLITRLSEVDTIVLPTDNKHSEEGMPLCLIEALSLGKPIIATDSGGNSEVVENNVNGFLIKSNPYIEELAEAMLKMSLDKDLYSKFSKAAYTTYIENHTYKQYTKKFTDSLLQLSYIKNGK